MAKYRKKSTYRRRTRTNARYRRAKRSRQQTVRVVIEQVPAAAAPAGPNFLTNLAKSSKRSKF